jgi:DNA-binding MarR family transcriptional regulator
MDARAYAAITARISAECVCGPMRMADRVLTNLYDEALRDHGLTIAQLSLLVAIEYLGERATPSAVAKAIFLERSTVTRDVDRLAQRGWVAREAHDDRRSQRLVVTPVGRTLIENAAESWEKAQAVAMDLLGEEGPKILRRILKRVRAERASEATSVERKARTSP